MWLYPNLSSGNFNGRVTIKIDVSSAQSYIAVHIKGLKITTSKLSLNNEQRTEIPLKECFEYSENEFWICELENPLMPNSYRLYFEFNGKLTNKIVGFYRSTYKDSDGVERYENFQFFCRNTEYFVKFNRVFQEHSYDQIRTHLRTSSLSLL